MSLLGNIIWLIFGGFFIFIEYIISGIWICLTYIVFAVLLGITIIGIQFAKQHLKFAALALVPFGLKIR